jgi:hypothetical protein
MQMPCRAAFSMPESRPAAAEIRKSNKNINFFKPQPHPARRAIKNFASACRASDIS